MKNVRKSLKVLQHTAGKENLTRVSQDKDAKLIKYVCINYSDKYQQITCFSDNPEVKKKKLSHKAVQTGECVITEEDLTSEEPSLDYWKALAEKRGESLNNSLQENDKLKDDIISLQEENRICREMLDESRNLVEVLQVVLWCLQYLILLHCIFFCSTGNA